MSEHTATVETLTAEVRVLVIGNRQVTLSVFRQLDWVPFSAVEPFGRVRSLTKAGRDDWGNPIILIEVVGRSKATGELCRTSVEDLSRYDPQWNQEAEAAKALPLIVLAGLK